MLGLPELGFFAFFQFYVLFKKVAKLTNDSKGFLKFNLNMTIRIAVA